MEEEKLLKRITVNLKIFGGKPIIRGRRLKPAANPEGGKEGR